MAELKFTYYPHPILRNKAKPLNISDRQNPPDEIIDLISAMKKICNKYDGVGLASQQVGLVLPVAVIGIPIPTGREDKFPTNRENNSTEIRGESGNSEYENGKYRLVGIVNPKIIGASENMQFWEEGCLSFPKLYLNIKRPVDIVVRAWFDDTGKIQERILHDMAARIACHEIDHLNGIVFIDRVEPYMRLKIKSELKRIARQHPEQEELNI